MYNYKLMCKSLRSKLNMRFRVNAWIAKMEIFVLPDNRLQGFLINVHILTGEQ